MSKDDYFVNWLIMGGIIKWRTQSTSMESKSHTICIAKSETLMPIDMHAQYQHVVKNNFAHQIGQKINIF